MSKLSQKKIQKIQEDILSVLFENDPHALFANRISEETARDNEFITRLLKDLQNKGLVTAVNKSKRGSTYLKRKRWTLTKSAYEAYNQLNRNI
jgi:predicted HTH transcriptional regulator